MSESYLGQADGLALGYFVSNSISTILVLVVNELVLLKQFQKFMVGYKVNFYENQYSESKTKLFASPHLRSH